MSQAFWNSGASAYADGLKADYQVRLEELKNQLAERFDPLQREEIAQAIKQLKTEYQNQIRSAKRNIH